MLWARALSVLALLFVQAPAPIPAAGGSVIDPDVPSLSGDGRTRVLVELRIGEAADPSDMGHAIMRAQDAVLARLPRTHATVIRRYASIPLLALEIDATGLRALSAMTDVVARVRPDTTARPQ
ncbi:MAG TPA: hypothetical protein VGL09_20455 [Methylomirabilota bacterium]|jgi:hypothetical protein